MQTNIFILQGANITCMEVYRENTNLMLPFATLEEVKGGDSSVARGKRPPVTESRDMINFHTPWCNILYALGYSLSVSKFVRLINSNGLGTNVT
ncbi:hypothetical protein J2S74_002552 [Evansella vedderi]|uniref:Uncharacterized protein n=1 Tax=Evansella vedderi TaxID=38282 RepID=A0ABT9ZW43_9BACI|nr:hypothetical protein [Evansella vedderi]MDQ0255170.1 hypothetical protein [Evansella vedderi]